MKIIFKTILPLILLFVVPMSNTQAEETATVVQSFNCNFINGKGTKDLDSAVTHWQEQIKKIDSEDMTNYFGAVLTPIVSNSDADFYWIGASPNLNSFARLGTAYNQSAAGQSADTRFEKMSKCKSNLFFSEQIYSGEAPAEGDNDGVLQGIGCTLKDGKTMTNVLTAEAGMNKVAAASGSKYSVYRWTPYLANVPVDLLYLVVYDDLESFASENTEELGSAEWEAAGRQFSEVMDCNSGLYSTRVVHAPPPTE